MNHQQLIWFAYFNTLKLDQKWWLISELQDRRFIHSLKPHQFLVRTHLHRELKAGDEILFNLGKETIHNFFDQNRIALAVSFDFFPDLTFEAGYLNWFQQQKTGNKYFDRDILRISLDHKIKTKRAS